MTHHLSSDAQPERTLGPVAQLEIACRNPIAMLLGASVGGIAPLATYRLAHLEALRQNVWNPLWLLVLGGLMFSAKTVWRWLYNTFQGDSWKATGWVLLVEGILVWAPVEWLAQTALGFLIAINAIANGSENGLRHEDDKRFLMDLQRQRENDPADYDESAEEATNAHALLPQGDVEGGELACEAVTPRQAVRRGRQRPSPVGESDVTEDALYQRAVEFAMESGRCSISLIQRHFNVGYNKAARVVGRMEDDGIIGPAVKAGGSRLVLLAPPRRTLAPAAG